MNQSSPSRFSLAALLALALAQHCPADEPTKAALRACLKLGDNLERLACYDRLVGTLGLDAAIPPAPGAGPAPGAVADATNRRSLEPSVAADMFGLKPQSEPKASPSNSGRIELNSIVAHVKSMQERPQRGALLELDNGQKWQQVGAKDSLLQVGDRVSISRGMFDSFTLMTPGNRVIQVKRIE